MRRLLLLAGLCAALVLPAAPTAALDLPLQINVGGKPNDRSGDTANAAFAKTMAAVNALYSALTLTPDTYDPSNKNATTEFVRKFWTQRQGNTVSPFDYCTGPCGKGQTNDTAAVQAAVTAVAALQAAGYVNPTVDLRGGNFAVNAKITMTGAPYGITFQNGGLIPFGGYGGAGSAFFDFSGTTATTDLRFFNLALNGFGTVETLVKMGPKTQGTFVEHNRFFGFTQYGFWDPAPVAGTENRVDNNVFQGGDNTNVGTAIRLDGNDSEVRRNLIRNVVTGIQTTRGGHAIFQNHIYSAISTSPISALTASIGDQIQVNDNYIDAAYLYINNPSNIQINNNKFFMTGSNVVGFSTITFRPTAAGQTLQNVLIQGNMFESLFGPPYNPVNIDTSQGTIGSVYQTSMRGNSFYGFNKMSTEPVGRGVASSVSNVSYNFAPNIPWGTLRRVSGGTVNPTSGLAYVQAQTISGTVGFLTFSGSTSGEWTLQGSVNDDPPF